MHLLTGMRINAFYLFIFLLHVSFYMYGQTHLRYTGPISLREYEVNADYQYDIQAGDTVLQGPFILQRSDLDGLISKGGIYFSLEGLFQDDLPDSTWRFRFGEFYVEKGIELIDYHFKVKLEGVEHIAIANFDKGKPQGEWIHTVKNIDSSQVEKTVFESHIEFQAGVPQGILRIENDRMTLLGRFLRNGFAHDTWALNFNTAPRREENWHFVKGRLKEIIIQRNQTTDTLKVYEKNLQRSKTVSLNKRYFQILSIQGVLDSSTYSKLGGGMPELMAENATYYQRIAHTFTTLKGLTGPIDIPTFQVEVAYFPLTNMERKQLRMIKTHLQKIDTISQSLLQNTRLNLLKHSDEDLLFLLSAVKEIATRYVSQARKVVQYEEAGLIDFFPHKQVPSGSRQQSFTGIEVPYQDSSGIRTRTFEGPIPVRIDTLSTGMAYWAELTNYAEVCLDSIERMLNKYLKNQKLQQELKDLEKTLITRADHLTALIDSLDDKLPPQYQPTLAALKATANRELRQFASEEDLLPDSERVRKLITCIAGLDSLAHTLSSLPDRWDNIQQLYTEEVWNPFTATIMEDQVKKQIIQAYDRLLIPAILTRIQTEINCANTQQFHALLDGLYERMQQLRIQNTSKLERKLKTVDDPKEAMELFEISI